MTGYLGQVLTNLRTQNKSQICNLRICWPVWELRITQVKSTSALIDLVSVSYWRVWCIMCKCSATMPQVHGNQGVHFTAVASILQYTTIRLFTRRLRIPPIHGCAFLPRHGIVAEAAGHCNLSTQASPLRCVGFRGQWCAPWNKLRLPPSRRACRDGCMPLPSDSMPLLPSHGTASDKGLFSVSDATSLYASST